MQSSMFTSSGLSTAQRLAAVSLFIFCLSLAACGGGGGTGQPDPGPNYPAAVEELSSSDIASAGLPDINSLASVSSKSSSMLDFPDETQLVINLSLGWDSLLASRNLAEAPGGGLKVDAPEAETGRVLAWGIFEIPGGADNHLYCMQLGNGGAGSAGRVFYALANQGLGGWEIGGRLPLSQGGGILNGGNFVNFSQSEDYSMPSGNSYLAVLFGHPGNGGFNGITLGYTEVEWTYLRNTASVGYPDEEYSMQWGEDSFSLIKDGTSNTLGFNIGMPPGFSARLALGTDMEEQLDMAPQWTDHNDSDPGVHFFDVNSMNGASHEYAYTQLIDGSVRFVNGAPLQDISGNGTANGIIAILIGLFGPIPDVSYVLQQTDLDNTPIVGVTDSRGRIVVDGLEEGSYAFGVGDDANPLLQFELQVQKSGEQYVGLLLPAVQ
ncbi:hypothetical protein KDL44_11855 [bacterium]|nr:hypothetical protein [bacterium]